MILTCYLCGGEFDGVPQARYCTPQCRKRIERIRARRTALEAEALAIAREIAYAARRGFRSRVERWRLAQVRARLAELEKFPP